MDIYRQALDWTQQGRTFALGAVVHTQGSTPQKAGAKALLDTTGALTGTLGGGLVEADALERMRQALDTGQPTLYEFPLDEEYSRTAGPICGGVMRLYATPNFPQNADAYRAAISALDTRQRGALVTNLTQSPSTTQWIAAGNGAPADPALAQAIDDALNTGNPVFVSTEPGHETFIEPVRPDPRLLIVGAGHVGQGLAHQADQLGFDVTVYDDRPDFAHADRFPETVATAHGNLRELVQNYPKDPDTYIVLVSKGHRPDAEALEACIHDEVAYLGMIGSKRKIHSLRKHFIEDQLATQEEFDRIVAPIGYDVGAITVPEIAVSIAAQLVAARRRPASTRTAGPKAL